MKKSKTSKPRTTTNKSVKNDEQWEEYLNTISLQMCPANGEMKKRLAVQLVTWVRENPRALSIQQFINLVGVAMATYTRWREQCPELQAAHEFAMMQFGLNRENLAIDNNLTMSHVTAYPMTQYLSNYADASRFREDIKKDNNDNSGPQIVVIERFAKEE